MTQLNPSLPPATIDEVVRRVTRPQSPSLDENNHELHRWLVGGVEVQVRRDGRVRGDTARLVDFDDPDRNDWLVVDQMTVIEGKYNRRPDLVVFLNGLPIAVIELKNPETENATLKSAWNQLQTYKSQIPSLFNSNEILVISDGTEAKVGSLTAGYEWFSALRPRAVRTYESCSRWPAAGLFLPPSRSLALRWASGCPSCPTGEILW